MDRMISDALVPPKPKLLFSTARTLRFLATWGTRSTLAQLSLGLSRLSVGGTIWSRRLSMQKIDSTAPAPPSRWTMEDLVDEIDTLSIDEPNSRRTAPSSSPSQSGVERTEDGRGGQE